jgi:hypothetical protein
MPGEEYAASLVELTAMELVAQAEAVGAYAAKVRALDHASSDADAPPPHATDVHDYIILRASRPTPSGSVTLSQCAHTTRVCRAWYRHPITPQPNVALP